MDRADEKTYALAAALATHSHGLETTALLADVRLLKEYVKAVDAASLAPGPNEYRESHEDFKRDHPNIYAQAFGHEEPTPTKWTKEFRNLILAKAPCRSSKHGVDLNALPMSGASCQRGASSSEGIRRRASVPR